MTETWPRPGTRWPGTPGLSGALTAVRVRYRRSWRMGRAGRGGAAVGPPPVAGLHQRHRIPHRPAPSAYPVRLRGDRQVALHGGDPGCRGGRRPGRSRLAQRVHVAVELRGVVGSLHPDVPGIDLRLAPEGVLDHRLDPLRAHRWPDRDGVRHSHHAPDLADRPLDLVPLVL